jgi:hypothetical protein
MRILPIVLMEDGKKDRKCERVRALMVIEMNEQRRKVSR